MIRDALAALSAPAPGALVTLPYRGNNMPFMLTAPSPQTELLPGADFGSRLGPHPDDFKEEPPPPRKIVLE